MIRSRIALAAALSIALVQTACAADGTGGDSGNLHKAPAPSGPLAKPASDERATPAEAGTAYYWYDGKRRVEMVLDPAQVADFRSSPPPSAGPASGTSSGNGTDASGVRGKASESRAPLRPKSAIEQTPDGSLPKGVSPVLREASAADSRAQALPGGVIVTLKERPAGSDAAAREARAREELRAAGLEPLRSIDAVQRVWLIASPAGVASLELANRLHESGAFESASPNWWRPRALK